MSKLAIFMSSILWVSLGFASGGGGGGSGGGAAAGGATSRAKEASPKKVYEAREKMRDRLQIKKQESNVKAVAGFDHNYTDFSKLLKKSVKFHSSKQKSTIDYEALSQSEIDAVANSMLALGKNQVMKQFSKKQRLAYFINLYNIMTIKLIKDRYSDVTKGIKKNDPKKAKKRSINNLKKGLWTSPWDQKFFKLFGQEATLNNIEHGYIRGDDKKNFPQSYREYDDPRIHFAVNCASVGCPAILDEAFVPERLAAQMQQAMVNFLKDRDRNYVKGSDLYLSPIISKWYKKDFSRGLLGYKSVEDFAVKNAAHLARNPQEKAKIEQKKLSIESSDYDWSLNDSL